MALIALLCLTSSLIAAAVMTHQTMPWRHRVTSSIKAPLTYEITMVVAQITRKVYLFSIVPGGAENLDEAKRAINDPAVKANYAAVDFAHLRPVKLKTNLSGYVSYRWADKVYWTSRALTLRAGETVFTDGVNLVRGRCLNVYSPRPMLPIRENEPTEQVLDTAVEMPVISYSFPRIPVEALELPPPPESLTPAVPIFPSASPAMPSGGIWFPLVPIIPPIRWHPPSPVPQARVVLQSAPARDQVAELVHGKIPSGRD